jgi:hypothetical protein
MQAAGVFGADAVWIARELVGDLLGGPAPAGQVPDDRLE